LPSEDLVLLRSHKRVEIARIEGLISLKDYLIEKDNCSISLARTHMIAA
jgi:hypothetical protein